MATEIEKMVELLKEEMELQIKECGKFSTEVSTLKWCLWRAEELVKFQNRFKTKEDE
jgi:hypothetical protein